MANKNKNLDIDNNRILPHSYDEKAEALRVLFVNEMPLSIDYSTSPQHVEYKEVEKTVLVDRPIYVDKPYIVKEIEYREIEKPIIVEKLVYRDIEQSSKFNDQHLREEIEVLDEKFQRQNVRFLEMIDEISELKKESKRNLKILSLISILTTVIILLFKHL